MELGEKLRAARLEVGLSQKALCGDTITRNMLSQIESGKARPSMDTLLVLSERLGRPLSWFLEESTALDRGVAAFESGNYRQALAALENCAVDGHVALLRKLCLLELGRRALEEKRLPYARELLHKAGEVKGAYAVPGLEGERQILLELAGGEAAPGDDRLWHMQAEAALTAGDYQRAENCLVAVKNRTDQWQLLMGRCRVAAHDFAGALVYLRLAEGDKRALPYLEQCCRELGDFKAAYEYACRLRELDH